MQLIKKIRKLLDYKYALAFILFLGFLLRVVDIDNNPAALYGDELTLVYDSYSILKTAHDQTGEFLPITFNMAGGRPGGYVYATVPLVALFGPTALAVRSISIISGLGIIFLIYLLGKMLFDKKVGLVAAGLIAISPWDIALSRGGFETHFALFLTLLGIVTFIASFKKPYLLIMSVLSFGLSIHTYSTYKLTVPIIILILIWFKGFRNLLTSIQKKYLLISITLFLVFVGILFAQILFGQSERRFTSINIFNQENTSQGIIQKINIDRSITTLPQPFSSIFHNKLIEYIHLIGTSYIQNISIRFLFLSGDRNPRHNPASSGELYLVELISLLIGFAILMRNKNKKLKIFILAWLLISPLPTALIAEPHALRDSIMLPVLILISAIGLTNIYSNTNRMGILHIKNLIILGFILEFLFIVDQVYFLSPNKFSPFWAYPAKLASEIAMKNTNYDYVILADTIDNIEFAYPVYANVNPSEVISQNKQKTNLNGRSFKRFKNVYIGYVSDKEVENFIKSINGSVLFINPYGAKTIENAVIVLGKDNIPALNLSRKTSEN